MAKCLRCGAGNEWIQGNVKDEPTESSGEWVRSMVEQPTKTGAYIVCDRGHSGYVLGVCEYWESQRPITNEFWLKNVPLPKTETE